MNPFLDETRSLVTSIDNGVLGKLRFGPTLRRTIDRGRPQHLPFGDFAVKSMYDQVLMRWIMEGHYEDVHATLEADWALDATSVASCYKRSEESRKPPAKSSSRRSPMHTMMLALVTLSLLTVGCASFPSGQPNIPADDLSRLGPKACAERGGKIVVLTTGHQTCVGAK